MKRLHNLDYLRGLAAFGIMIYHYMTAEYGQYDADSFFGRLGMYGVSVFYVLSGLTLYLVYHDKMEPSKSDVLAFAKKRFFRIFPLLWLATFCMIILSRRAPDLYMLFLNVTGLFGIFDWDAAFATGAWSIGNELVFYIFFPVFMFLLHKSKPGLIILSLVILSIYLYFAFAVFDPGKTLTVQWKTYVNPLNQVFLFLSGFLIGVFFRNTKVHTGVNAFILLGGFALFILYPATGERINLTIGTNRIVFTICCILVCFGFFKMKTKFPEFINKPFTLLGEASYSVYLLHPIVFAVLKSVFKLSSTHFYTFSSPIQIITGIIASLVISYLVYEKFEKYFMKLGHSRPAMLKQNVPGSNNV